MAAKLPAQFRTDADGGLEAFSCEVVRLTSDVAAAVKFQSACYERHLDVGIRALHRSIALARSLGLLVILDAKRGDIGISADHYAAAAAAAGAHWITVSPYLGMETVEPYLKAGLGVFVLVRTSNPGAASIQHLPVNTDGTPHPLCIEIAAQTATLGRSWTNADGVSAVGAVVGATHSNELAALRAAMPTQPFLLPGIGAQGATIADVASAFDPATAGGLATASRSIIYPDIGAGGTWEQGVRDAAASLHRQLIQGACA